MLRLSKTLHCLALLSFLLPFFYTGCGESIDEEKRTAREKWIQDSISTADSGMEVSLGGHGDISADEVIALQYSDTVPEEEISLQDSDSVPENTVVQKDNTAKVDSGISKRLAAKYVWLQPVLIPSDDTYTGLAILIDGARYIRLYSVIIGFILLLLALIFKLIQKNAVYAIILTEALGIASVLASHPLNLFAEREWGYWVFAGISGALLILDIMAGFFKRPVKRQEL